MRRPSFNGTLEFDHGVYNDAIDHDSKHCKNVDTINQSRPSLELKEFCIEGQENDNTSILDKFSEADQPDKVVFKTRNDEDLLFTPIPLPSKLRLGRLIVKFNANNNSSKISNTSSKCNNTSAGDFSEEMTVARDDGNNVLLTHSDFLLSDNSSTADLLENGAQTVLELTNH